VVVQPHNPIGGQITRPRLANYARRISLLFLGDIIAEDVDCAFAGNWEWDIEIRLYPKKFKTCLFFVFCISMQRVRSEGKLPSNIRMGYERSRTPLQDVL
jgi:hypothetical protein